MWRVKILFSLRSFSILLLWLQSTFAYNFQYESIQLKDSDVTNISDLAFAKGSTPSKAKCKTFPGDSNWPSFERWSAFNVSLGGALIKGIPPAAACYDGPYKDAAKCALVRRRSFSALFAMEDPLIPFEQWTLGNPCPAPAPSFPGFPGVNVTTPQYTCNVSSFPAYVVNATTVKHIQLAINFARNNNIRLTIKNTGHDFLGRNTGGGALQIWVHHLKGFGYLSQTQIAEYEGQAARVGAALQQYELFPYMEENNITLLAPGSSTVGAYGGFMQGGGFSYLTSKFGLMADQILSLEVVTADGRFVHADSEENEDLFWAIRGGGPSNFGIVTSAVVKAYPPITVATSRFTFGTALPFSNFSTAVPVSNTTFWRGVSAYFSHLVRINDAKGIGWNYISTIAPMPFFNITSRTFSFIGEVTIPGISSTEMKDFVAPIIQDLNKLGINITNPQPNFWESYPKSAHQPNGPSGGVGNGRFASRLFPRSNFEDPESDEFNVTMASIRAFVEEGGYSFHSGDYHPSIETAGYPGSNSAVNPHLRTAIMHGTGFDRGSYGPDVSAEQMIRNHARLN